MDASLTGPKTFGFGLKASGPGCVVKAFAFNPMMGSISPDYPCRIKLVFSVTNRVLKYRGLKQKVFKQPSLRVMINCQPYCRHISNTVLLGYRPSASIQTGRRGKCFFILAASRTNAFCSQSCFSKSLPGMFSINSEASDMACPADVTSLASRT